MRNKIDYAILQRCLNDESFGWEDFVDRFMSPVLHVVKETARMRQRLLDESRIRQYCEAVFRAFRYNNCQLLREFEYRSSLLTYLIILTRRLTIAFLK